MAAIAVSLLSFSAHAQSLSHHFISSDGTVRSYDFNMDGTVDGLSIAFPEQTQFVIDFDHDGRWDYWELRNRDGITRFENRVGAIFTKVTFERRSPQKATHIRLRYSPALRSYVIATTKVRAPRSHAATMDLFDEIESDADSNCGNGAKDNFGSTQAMTNAALEQAIQDHLRETSMVDESCKRLDKTAASFNNLVSSLARQIGEPGPSKQSFLTCMTNAGWRPEALRIRSYFDRERMRPTPSLVQCSAPARGKPAGEYNDGTDRVTIRTARPAHMAEELIEHEVVLHAAGGFTDQKIELLKECCPSGTKTPTKNCKNPDSNTSREALLYTLDSLKGAPDLQEAILEIYATAGAHGLGQIRLELKKALESARRTLKSRAKSECGDPTLKSSTCDDMIRQVNRQYLHEARKLICRGDAANICVQEHQPFSATITIANQACVSSKDTCALLSPSQENSAKKSGDPLFNMAALDDEEVFQSHLRNDPAPAPAAQAQAPVIGPKVNLDDPREAREALQKSERQAFDVYRNAGQVYTYVAQKTRDFTQSLAARSDSEPTRRDRTPRASTSTSTPTTASSLARSRPSSGSKVEARNDIPTIESPNLPGANFSQASATSESLTGASSHKTVTMPKIAITPTAYIPSSTSANNRGSDTPPKPSARKEDSATLLGIPIAAISAGASQVAASAPVRSLASSPLPLPGRSARGGNKMDPSPGVTSPRGENETSSSSDSPFGSRLAELKKPYRQVESLFKHGPQRAAMLEYFETQRIRLTTPTGESFGHARPRLHIIYSDTNTAPEFRRVGR